MAARHKVGLDVRVRLEICPAEPVHAGNPVVVLAVQGVDSADCYQANEDDHGKDQDRGHQERVVTHLGEQGQRDHGSGEY